VGLLVLSGLLVLLELTGGTSRAGRRERLARRACQVSAGARVALPAAAALARPGGDDHHAAARRPARLAGRAAAAGRAGPAAARRRARSPAARAPRPPRSRARRPPPQPPRSQAPRALISPRRCSYTPGSSPSLTTRTVPRPTRRSQIRASP